MEERKKRDKRNHPKRFEKPELDLKVQDAIKQIEDHLANFSQPAVIKGLNGFQRKAIHRFFSRNHEYQVKALPEGENNVILKVYAVGKLRRLAETKAQEVLMNGEPQIFPPMGSYERFVVHDYIKSRGGLRTESHGEGLDRHVEIFPVFGRTLRKTKRKLTR